MFNRIRRAYLLWQLRLIYAEIRDTQREQKDAEDCGDVTEVLNLESYLQALLNKRRALRHRLDQVPQPT